MAKIGRPTKYSPELATTICQCIEDGQTIEQVCKIEDMPAVSSIYLWKSKYTEFSESLTRAQRIYWQIRGSRQVGRLEDIKIDEECDPRITQLLINRAVALNKTEEVHLRAILEEYRPQQRGFDAGVLVNNLVIIANLDGKLNSRLGIGDTPLLPEPINKAE